MNVGDYVRTKDYGFIKVKSFYYNEDMIHILDENCNEYDFSKELVDDFKSSPNIIDLIEAGDYVNGKKVIGKQSHRYEEFPNWCLFFENEELGIYEYDIKSIVTREQFESMEYKVGE